MSWVFGPGGTSATPGGADKDIQFNNNGEFSGSNLLTTDGSGSLSASVHVSASTYYGDGSNLTGVTASAVNVADGPEFSLQFRRDTPVTGEISGSENFSVSSDMARMSVTGTLIVSGATAANIEGPVIITSPEGKLEVQDTTNNYQVTLIPAVIPRVAFGTISNETQYMVVDGGNTNRIITNNDFFVATSSTFNQGLYYDVSLERFGINTSTPTHDFTVSGSISGSGNISGSNLYIASGKSIFFDGSTETFKITNNGTNLDINGANIILNAATQVSASTDLSASGFFGEELETTSDAVIKGQVKVGPGTGVGYVTSNGDPDTRIRFGAAGLGSDSMSIEAGGKAFIVLDENGRDELTLGTGVADVIHASGSLTASVGLRVSASAAIGHDIFVGSGTDRTIGVLVDGSDDFFVMGHDGGAVTLSASNGVEFVGGTDGVGSFGSDIKVYETQAGSTTKVSLTTSGIVSGSGQLQGASVAVDGIVTTHRVQIDDGSQLGTDSDTDMITLNNGSDVTIASDLELRVGNLTQNRVATVGANSKLTDHSNFTFASDVLSVPTITASVGIDVTSSANGSINIGEGISYTFGGNGRLDVFENEFKLRKTNLYQAVFSEQTSNFDIGDSQIFLVNTNGSVVTGTLPGVNSSDDYGVTYTIKDSGGNAGTNDVVIEPSGSQKIDGGTAAKITTNYGAITVVGISSSVNGLGWAIVSAT